ncbi:MAG: alanine racemase [Patescibacteria group bacterium]
MTSVIHISKSALRHNLRQFKKLLQPETKIMAMVKANAYGHGQNLVVPTIASQVDFFGVATLTEAQQIRNLKIQTPILVCAPIDIPDIPKAVSQNISICIPSLEYLKQVSRYPLKVHLKINTGMNRLGISTNEIREAIKIIQNSSLSLDGVYTHFHSPESKSVTQKQLELFKTCVSITKKSFPNVLVHAAKTAAIIDYPDSHFDMVRLGIGLYGLWQQPKNLKPVLSWTTQVTQSRKVERGETIGYSATHQFKKSSFTAVLPVGYYDGLDRGLSNTPSFVGRISMNFSTIQTPKLLKPGTTIDLIGKDLSTQALASRLDTIPYEVITRLNPLISRILVD